MKIFRNPRDDWLVSLPSRISQQIIAQKNWFISEMNQFLYLKFGQGSHRINLLYDLHEF